MQHHSLEKRLFEGWTRFVVIGSIGLLIGLCAAYANLSAGAFWKNIEELTAITIANLVTVPIVFLSSYFILRQYERARTEIESADQQVIIRSAVDAAFRRALGSADATSTIKLHSRFDGFDWSGLLSDTARVQIIAHYLGTWTRSNEPSIRRVVASGGSFQVIVPDHRDDELVGAVSRRLPDTTMADVRAKMQQTAPALRNVAIAAGHVKAIRIGYTSRLPWYSAFAVNGRRLIICPFDQERLTGTGINSPVFEIDLEAHPEVKSWFDQELSILQRKTAKITTKTGA